MSRRNAKIARLPKHIRIQVNRMLDAASVLRPRYPRFNFSAHSLLALLTSNPLHQIKVKTLLFRVGQSPFMSIGVHPWLRTPRSAGDAFPPKAHQPKPPKGKTPSTIHHQPVLVTDTNS